MNADASRDETLSAAMKKQIDKICDRFEAAWKVGQRLSIEKHLTGWEKSGRSSLLRELLILDVRYRQRSGETPSREDYRARFPDDIPVVNEVFWGGAELPQGASTSCQENDKTVDYGPQRQSHDDDPMPDKIGRYEVRRLLGKGGFGSVYLAYDETLRRDVAIKVPRRDRVSGPEDIRAYIAEARTIASLRHPHIVPVHDVGQLADGRCYVVSEYIEGTNLGTKIKQAPFSHKESAPLVATVAEALHYAHGKEVVHCDIKPANILLDVTGKPYIADFGLALREEDYGRYIGMAGTPSYMSPEQARGEGHLVDGRSDVFSLGVVFYELLTEKRPFRGRDSREVLQAIRLTDARPPRQLKDSIPKELERICLKALSNLATNRYMTALDMVEDLRHFLRGPQVVQPGIETRKPAVEVDVGNRGGEPERRPPTVVPKGLRSFDAEDAGFFFDLLPGPRDRDGLPESIRFWKIRIEQTDPDQTFRIGLIYGPSGCGKSSLVKAGLLPRLAEHVVPVYIEATAEDTEKRLLRSLRKRCRELPDELNLADTLAAMRRGQQLRAGRKLVIVLDQFEQWLQATQGDENTELVDALRHCDGGHVQCVVLVRDDFGMPMTRFMAKLESPIVEGTNFKAVDLFDQMHARKVLIQFGRAYGRLAQDDPMLTSEQSVFLNEAVSGLSQDGWVVCVRLALFAEMAKGKSWTSGTLEKVGGTEGVGVTFLEETFSSPSANPKHRMHQKAVRGVLAAMLPESGAKIKGSMRSYDELLEVSRYSGRPGDFAELIRILDQELRLITPTDPVGEEAEGESAVPVDQSKRYYKLTHDYLVLSLATWLTRKQKETRRGRAELRLADRSDAWNRKSENRYLPAWWEFFSILQSVPKRGWTPPQRKMMRTASRYHAVQGCIALLILAGVITVSITVRSAFDEQRAGQRALRAISSLYIVLKDKEVRLPAASLHSVGEIVPHLKTLEPIHLLDLSDCLELPDLTGIADLTNLQELHLNRCAKLSKINDLGQLTDLRELYLNHCRNLSDIGGLRGLSNLQILNLSGCSKLSDVTSLGGLTELRELELNSCIKLSDINGLRALVELQLLDLSGCPRLTEVNVLADLVKLKELYLNRCLNLSNFRGLRKLTNLQELHVRDTKLMDVKELQHLVDLEVLDLSHCYRLSNARNLVALSSFTKLQVLNLGGLEIEDCSAVQGLINLRTLSLRSTKLRDLKQLRHLTKLETLDVSDCNRLSDLSALAALAPLEVHLNERQAEQLHLPDGVTKKIVRGTVRETERGTFVPRRTPIVHESVLRGRRLGQLRSSG